MATTVYSPIRSKYCWPATNGGGNRSSFMVVPLSECLFVRHVVDEGRCAANQASPWMTRSSQGCEANHWQLAAGGTLLLAGRPSVSCRVVRQERALRALWTGISSVCCA